MEKFQPMERHKVLTSIRARALSGAIYMLIAAAAVAKDGPCVVEIMSIPTGAPIIVDGDYIGNAPIKVDLFKYGAILSGAIELDDIPTCSPPKRSYILVKALPPGNSAGCTAMEMIRRATRVPRRMLLDTRLCPIPDETTFSE